MAVHRAPQASGRQRRLLFIVPPVIILLALLALVFLGDLAEVDPELDADLCPIATADISQRAVFLVDLTKPLDDARLPGAVLHDVTMELEANAELRVLSLGADAGAPRDFVARLCKPYANADLAFTGAKDSAATRRDCTDMAAQVPPPVRANAERFCEQRAAVAERLEQLAASRSNTSAVRNAYLIEALEETNLEFAESPGAHALHVFSDMMQHADWYSQPELGWEGWSFGEFEARRGEQDALVGARPPHLPGMSVTLFYAPREGMTDRLRVKNIHKEFWRRYFAGTVGPTFRDQPLQSAYAVAPPSRSGADSAQEERLKQEEARRELQEIEAAREALEAARESDQPPAQAPDQAEPGAGPTPRAPPPDPPPQEQEAPAAQTAPAEPATPEPEAATAEAEAATPEPEAAAAEAEAEVAVSVPEEVAAAPGESAAQVNPPTEQAAAPAEAAHRAPETQPAGDATMDAAETPPPAGDDADGQPEVATCSVALRAEFQNVDVYPGGGRVNYGTAMILVRYTINEAGFTENVVVVEEESTVQSERYRGLFERATVMLVEQYRFDFDDVETGCERRREMTTRLGFVY